VYFSILDEILFDIIIIIIIIIIYIQSFGTKNFPYSIILPIFIYLCQYFDRYCKGMRFQFSMQALNKSDNAF